MPIPVTFAETAAQFFFPQRHCPACGAVSGGPHLCAACQEKQAALQRCERCATFVSAPMPCDDCLLQPPAFQLVRAALPYEGLLREHLQALKYHESTWLKRPLGQLLAALLAEHYTGLRFDAVVPVPLASSRARERGYNQSALLAKPLAARFGIPYRPDLLRRVQETPVLHRYDGPARRKLLQDAFQAANAEKLQVLLVDDIYTSGATMNACSKVLLASGATAVYGLTVAAQRQF